ncbi:MAG: type II toxin-antitoxin system RelE/ParE family toxin [Bacteroidetes bacterium]|jgi:mRNA interferase RelE/StbE|nr:type II toxin-antitoxin system RelE/ParE family toxin [Bacteroidota bacterium]MBP9136579.1 type II toxin-antitoxin system RelE/ParE family toxin [Chitinophagales bacterium]MBK8672949.1 type II toxin-antitoxin system RelE/ParE family toxin [Bacteroidota bacterium]MBK9635731.1 type II toxin-antitoxin system RelE/ParE family toxin [Bacteroidota bacterium]MBL0077737.1 type II toxin-antitoxin system RelE/ParE family toxin [Bacteroidota bacterium]
MYELQYKKKAIKVLAKINDPYYSAIIQAIDELAENPRPHGYKKLTGRSGYRIRVGIYRIIYDIFDTTLIVEIVNVGSRGDIYED